MMDGHPQVCYDTYRCVIVTLTGTLHKKSPYFTHTPAHHPLCSPQSCPLRACRPARHHAAVPRCPPEGSRSFHTRAVAAGDDESAIGGKGGSSASAPSRPPSPYTNKYPHTIMRPLALPPQTHKHLQKYLLPPPPPHLVILLDQDCAALCMHIAAQQQQHFPLRGTEATECRSLCCGWRGKRNGQ